ncbi:tyrosine-type recombinase/integrase [Anaerotignum lactatifermentans]|uniref:Tyrosine-type recombinase/integrase n=1 Tax=Anaerotignum lactatifermentans TaxID=160404 RepID=A0ABS2GAT7_9FIRM|nr:tyrosine-type recombinase/integrase [Anaerotignum lactatifermentans]MBM6828633.1 tyrosine-type recombinase/integrase [Anaerotignum lactatifermentans]MBM6878551.1 tyrosine-type recombinase/integrase [Anaerotignum lactatifermentans]MBM6950215.1 tyrosine-type recombinase/integrase [Anaerotignum lactatifermentans]
MKKVIVTKEVVEGYLNYLKAQEKSQGTLEKYRRELYELMFFLSDTEVRKEELLLWKGALEKKYCPSGVNGRLVAANGFFTFLGRFDLRMKLLRIQKEIFSREEKEMTRAEYTRLVRTAEERGNQRLSLVMQTICATGIRVSELRYITAEAVKRGRAEVNCKGKHRVIFFPRALQKKLIHYGKKKGIRRGALFITKNGNPLNRSNIWAEMKKLCQYAQVSEEKVFPHNLRHLFARIFYALEKDIAKLADLLGHSSIETTRIYIMESGKEHQKRLEKMRLVL